MQADAQLSLLTLDSRGFTGRPGGHHFASHFPPEQHGFPSHPCRRLQPEAQAFGRAEALSGIDSLASRVGSSRVKRREAVPFSISRSEPCSSIWAGLPKASEDKQKSGLYEPTKQLAGADYINSHRPFPYPVKSSSLRR